MTEKEWALVLEAHKMESQLHQTMNEVKVIKGDRKKKLEMDAKRYEKFLMEHEALLARVFGDEEVVKDIQNALRDIMVNRLGLKVLAA